MIKHIVMMKFYDFADGQDKHQNLLKAKKLIEGLQKEIPEIVELVCGINCNADDSIKSFDIVIDSVFKNIDDINTYKIHPAHLELVDYLNLVREKTSFVDYEF